MKRGFIFASGRIDFKIVPPPSNAVIVAVDSGFKTLSSLKIPPDFGIGDFDSLSPEEVHELRKIAPTQRYPRHKDQTDLELALRWCVRQKIEAITIFGALHSRFDHSLSALFDSSQYDLEVTFVENEFTAAILNEKRPMLSFFAASESWISIFALSEDLTLESEGLEWPLSWQPHDTDGSTSFRRSQSNRPISDGFIRRSDGLALVLQPTISY